ncbi:MAG: hypothetical protein ACRDYV_03780 [Acidimicrobiia bacterium]
MNRRLTALLAAGSLALLGACGGGGGTAGQSGSAADKAGASGDAAETSALDLVLASAGRAADAKTSRFEFTMALTGPDGNPFSLTATGASDSSVPLMSLNMDMASIIPGTPPGGATISTIVDGKAVYMRFPDELAAGLPGGKRWARMDLAALSADAGIDVASLAAQFNSSDPLANIALLTGAAGEVTELGAEDVRGTSTRHLRMTVDLQKATEQLAARLSGPTAERLQAAVTQAAATVGVTQMPIEAWIDADGLPRRLAYEMDLSKAKVPGAEGAPATGTARVSMEFFDFGSDVDVDLPPADETIDFAELLGGPPSS